MYPWIKEGDLIFIQSTRWEDIRRGDIVAYQSNDENIWIAHRVIRKEKEFLLTRGDGVISPGRLEKVPRSHLVGKAIFVQKRNGKILNLEHTRFIYYLIKYALPLWWVSCGLIKHRNPLLVLKKTFKKAKEILSWIAKYR